MLIFSFCTFRYDDYYLSDTSVLEARINNLFNLIDSYFITDLSVNFFFNPERFSINSNIRSMINRHLMCTLLEENLAILSNSAYGYSLSISSSHTADAGVVGFALSNKRLRIGLDIEHIDRIIPFKVASYISNNSDHLHYRDNFLRYWVLKESIFKSRFNLFTMRDVCLHPLLNGNPFNFSISNEGSLAFAIDFKIDNHLIGLSLGGFQC